LIEEVPRDFLGKYFISEEKLKKEIKNTHLIYKIQTNSMSVYSWGCNAHGELGTDSERSKARYDPLVVAPFDTKNIIQVACGLHFSLLLDEFGVVYSVGECKQGRLGRDSNGDTVVRGPLLSRRVAYIAAGYLSSAAITDDGCLFEWGLVHFDPAEETASTSRSIETMQQASNQNNNFYTERLKKLVEDSEKIYLSESNVSLSEADRIEGVLNMRTRRKEIKSPTFCESLEGVHVVKVCLGEGHTVVLSDSGTLYSKGYNDRGQLGSGHRFSRSTFEKIDFNETRIKDVVCGTSHTLVLTTTFKCLAFGQNAFGQLGIGPRKEKSTPTQLDFEEGNEEDIVLIASGDYHCLALSVSGRLFSWGHSEYGQHAATEHRGGDLGGYAHLLRYYTSPRLVTTPSDMPSIKSIHAAGNYSLVVDKSGTVWSWGWNAGGVLGRRQDPYMQPIDALAGMTVKHLSAGPMQVMAIIKQLGSMFAHGFASLLLDSAHHDMEIAASKLTTVSVHKFMCYARCPELKPFENENQILLPFPVEQLVLNAFVEYLYCDHIRKCPPHRVVDLQELADKLKCDHLSSLCQLVRLQRRVRIQKGGSIAFHVVPSTFSSDMKAARLLCCDNDVILVGEDDQSVRAHIDILTRYEFFRGLLLGSFREGITSSNNIRSCKLKGVKGAELQSMVDWMYRGDRTAVMTWENIPDLLSSAYCYGLDDLGLVLEKHLTDTLDAEDIATLANQLQSQRLKA